jgi:PAS domain S-box-containing protein
MSILGWGKSKSGNTAENGSGLAVSDKLIKDQRLNSDFILGAIVDGVVMVSNDNVIQLFNHAASNISGWPVADAIGLDFHSVLPLVNEKGEPQAPQNHPFVKALSTGTTIRDNKSWLATKGGKRVPVSMIVSPVLQVKGRGFA